MRRITAVGSSVRLSNLLLMGSLRMNSSSSSSSSIPNNSNPKSSETASSPSFPPSSTEQSPQSPPVTSEARSSTSPSDAATAASSENNKGRPNGGGGGAAAADDAASLSDTTTTLTSSSSSSSSSSLQTPDPEPERWVQAPYQDPDLMPIKDEKGEYIVSAGNWPTGEVAYRTPPPPDKLAPRFGYNVLQVKKDVTWWQHYHKYPRLSVSYINIHFWFIIGAAWLGAFLTEEYRRTTDEMKTPGALVGEHRGRGPSTKQTQKVSFTPEEMNALVNTAQTNWVDGKGEQSFIGSKDYRMKQIARPKEFSLEDVRKR